MQPRRPVASAQRTHTNAYGALIDGLVADGIWAKTDVMYVLATADATTAGLNLKSTSYTLSEVSSPAFTADQGYASNGTTSYVDTTWNTSTNSVQFTRDSAYIAIRNNTSATSDATYQSAGTSGTHIAPRSATASCYARVNGSNAGISNTQRKGFYIASRTTSTLTTVYKAGSSIGTTSAASAAIVSRPVFICCYNVAGTPTNFSVDQISFVAFGAGLDATEAANFNTRVEAYMTAVGAP
jgi:hypothetical protein